MSLEDCEVEKDITSFILDRGTGQDIPGKIDLLNSKPNTNRTKMPPSISTSAVAMSRTMIIRKLGGKIIA